MISGSAASLKSSLYICKFSVHTLLKPSMNNFEHKLASLWNEHNCTTVWTLFGLNIVCPSLVLEWKLSCGYCWVFQICWHIECSTLTASSFRILNNSAGIPSPPLALFIIMLPKAQLTLYSMMSSSRWVTTESWLSESLRTFCVILLCIPATSL